MNLCYHKEDFGVQAEWHFYATPHDKGPCDGIGGTVKCFSVAKEERVTHLSKTEIVIHEIKGFVTAVYENDWWLGCVLQVN